MIAAKTHPEFEEHYLTLEHPLKMNTGPSHCFQKANFTNITLK